MSASNSSRLFGLAAVLVAAAALAYVLPAYSILRRAVERRDELRLSGVQVKGTATFAPGAATGLGAPADKEVQADATVSLKLPGRCRFEVSVPEGNSSASIVAGGKRLGAGTQLPSVAEAVAQLCPLLALKSANEGDARAGLEQHLRTLGVEQQKTSLSRFDGRIVYVLGDPAEGKPQLWLFKDSFLPARVLYADAAGTAWDVRLRDFGSPVAGDWFPRIVEVHKDGQQVLKFTALEANGRARLADELFAPAAP